MSLTYDKQELVSALAHLCRDEGVLRSNLGPSVVPTGVKIRGLDEHGLKMVLVKFILALDKLEESAEAVYVYRNVDATGAPSHNLEQWNRLMEDLIRAITLLKIYKPQPPRSRIPNPRHRWLV